MTHEECCNVILWAPAIVDLAVRPTRRMGLPDLPFPVAHSRIETLAVQNNQPYFFGLLDLPALCSLKITTHLVSLYLSIEICVPFLSRSRHLQKFSFDEPGIPLEIIRSMTQLTELALWNTPWWLEDDFFQMLDPGYKSDTPPDLQAVVL
ncbi:hypothetical protein DFH08DRAFT_951120 [Mycena albidolilacea]|uniref:Uncharacterized protein n=1 Tax=Mycena albidolilacea TaxID=1033008 RepID=A0AAD7F2W8_9AGAR|nr:hypothetical protein DFH08DRAFT_951120 [Mycena albidolilacea]